MSNEKAKYAWEDSNVSDEERKRKREEEVLRLTLPPFRYKRSRIAKELHLSITVVWQIRKKLVEEGKLVKDERGRIKNASPEKTARLYDEIIDSEFGQIPSMKIMIDNLKKSNKKYDQIIGYFYKVCKTISRHPDDFKLPEQIVEQYKDEFIEKFSKGESFYIDKEHPKRFENEGDTSAEHYLNSIRSFRKANNIPLSRGFLKLPSNKNMKGKYARIKLSDSERLKGIIFMAQFGDLWKNLFILQTEIGLRLMTLLKFKSKFERRSLDVDGMPCEFFFSNVYEAKQESARSGGNYDKIIITQEARELIRNIPYGTNPFDLKEFQGSSGYISYNHVQKQYNDYLRQFYQSIGRLEKGIRYKKGTDEWYYSTMPSHSLRHSCIHWLARCTDNDIQTVASMFWDGPTMMNEFYHKRSALEGLLAEGMCNYCQPQTYPDPNWNYFCKFLHSLIWYNYGKNQQQIKQESENKKNNLPQDPTNKIRTEEAISL